VREPVVLPFQQPVQALDVAVDLGDLGIDRRRDRRLLGGEPGQFPAQPLLVAWRRAMLAWSVAVASGGWPNRRRSPPARRSGACSAMASRSSSVRGATGNRSSP
jgi:hypothetical protein